jgi:hypothetical protein
MEEIMNAYTLEFFKKYLEDKSSPLLDGQPPLFPEVSFRARRAGQ